MTFILIRVEDLAREDEDRRTVSFCTSHSLTAPATQRTTDLKKTQQPLRARLQRGISQYAYHAASE